MMKNPYLFKYLSAHYFVHCTYLFRFDFSFQTMFCQLIANNAQAASASLVDSRTGVLSSSWATQNSKLH